MKNKHNKHENITVIEKLKILISKLDNKQLDEILSPKKLKSKIEVRKNSVKRSKKTSGLSRKPKGKRQNPRNLGKIVISDRRLDKISQIYSTFFDIEEVEDIRSNLSLVTNYFNSLINDNGLTAGTKRFREVRTYTIKIIAGLKPEKVPKCLSLHKGNNWPSDLNPINRVMKRNNFDYYQRVRYFNSLMSLPRICEGRDSKLKFESKSITRTHLETDGFRSEIEQFKEWLPSYLSKVGIPTSSDPSKLYIDMKPHFYISSGPNSNLLKGANALITAHYDAKAVMMDDDVYRRLAKISSYCHFQWFIEWISDLSRLVPDNFEIGKLVASRLSVLKQPENKLRTVAIVDYYSQMVLRPIHQYVDDLAKSVPCSFVHDQDAGRELCKEFTTDPNGSPVSDDATDFTDRFHRKVQEALLEILFNKEFAHDVILLMTHRRFKTPDGRFIRYGAGQPMGAFLSFPLASMTHALYASFKAEAFGLDPSTDIAVVGDDIAFRKNGTAYEQYVLGMQHLGVDFNKFKGFTSVDNINIVEFCKRIYINGVDCSTISSRAVSKATNDFKACALLDQYLNIDQLKRLISLEMHSKYKENISRMYSLPSSITGLKTNNFKIGAISELIPKDLNLLEKLSERNIGTEALLLRVYNEIMSDIVNNELEMTYSRLFIDVIETEDKTTDELIDESDIIIPENQLLVVSDESDTETIRSLRNRLKKNLSSDLFPIDYSEIPIMHPLMVALYRLENIKAKGFINESFDIRLDEHSKQFTDLLSYSTLRLQDEEQIGGLLIDKSQQLASDLVTTSSSISDDARRKWINSLFVVSNTVIEALKTLRFENDSTLVATLYAERDLYDYDSPVVKTLMFERRDIVIMLPGNLIPGPSASSAETD